MRFLGPVRQNEKGSENDRRAVKVSGPGSELGSEEERGQKRGADSLPSLDLLRSQMSKLREQRIIKF